MKKQVAKKYLLTLGLTLIVFAGILSNIGYAKNSPVKLRVGYNATGGGLLTFIAQDQKLFKKEGLAVELLPFISSSDGLSALNSGKIDLGVSFGTTPPLVYINEGADFLIIGGQLSGGSPIYTLPEKADQFKSIKDFKGKTVAVPRLSTLDVVWRRAMLKAGLDPVKDTTIIEMKNAVAVVEAVKAGKVDVGIATTVAIYKGREAGLVPVFWSNDLFPDHPCCRVVAIGKAVKKQPGVYQAFLKALIQAEKIREVNPELVVDINRRYLNIEEDMARYYTLEPHQLVNADPNRIGVIQFWKTMNQVGYIKSDLKIDRFINVKLYKRALDELAKESPSDKFYRKLLKRYYAQN